MGVKEAATLVVVETPLKYHPVCCEILTDRREAGGRTGSGG